MKQLTAGSLFSGAGMMDYAFAQAGFDIRFQVEIDPYCRKVLAKHAETYWPDAKIYSDVRGVTRQQLGYVDVLFGGFPCQDISIAGARAGISSGTRSGLWYEFARLIGDIRPRVVLLENVPRITGRDGVKVITSLTQMGYDCRWGVISASDVYAPHQRDRWWCVAFDMGYTNGQRHDGSTASTELCDDKEWHDSQGKQAGGHKLYTTVGNDQVGYADGDRRGECNFATLSIKATGSPDCERSGKDGVKAEWPPNKPRLDRSPDGPSVRLDRRHGLIVKHQWPAAPNEVLSINEPPRMAPGNPNTNRRIKALGNGAIPQIVYPIALYLKGMLLAAESERV